MWHCIQPWLEALMPNPLQSRALMGRLVRDYGRDAVILAFDRTLEASPRPADPFTYFTKLVSSNDKVIGDAQSAWNTVVRLSQNCSTANLLASDAINAAVYAIGGWQKIGHADKRMFGGFRSQFIQAYQEGAKNGTAKNPD